MTTILVSLAHLDQVENVINFAAFVASKTQAHVIGYYPIPGPSISVLAYPGAYVPMDDRIQKIYEEQAESVRSKFEDRMKRDGINFEWRQQRMLTSDITKGVVDHGRECDLIMISQDFPDKSKSNTDIHLSADIILSAGRPVLVVPSEDGLECKLDKIVVGWNASREACRAAFDSLPLLKLADDVHLTWVNPEKTLGKGQKLPGAELGAALARHDVKVTATGLNNRSKPGLALINYARDQKADLLVMGAYGHSRLRERILGGATEYVLHHMDRPILLSN
ncbi:MAG: universal stress protein [Acidimicrobiales bacterium]|nr:universal stress protein [Hyphomonadaceae bacterium]RZV43957.1 MAG: universal stress protein [Acidimicrobiales bacterium]